MSDSESGEARSPYSDANEAIPQSPRHWVWLAGLAIVLAGSAAYVNSFRAEFADDSILSILQNPTIAHGWWEALHPPMGSSSVSGRPVVNLTLALNYWLGGFEVWGYHLFNLAIHVLAGLALFGLMRRTLRRPGLRDRYRVSALPLAFAAALLWTVHPLQTESVTYVIQRAESLMGLFYLLTLYCFVRAQESPRVWAWSGLSATACLLGMMTKETMVTAPVMVLLYDRTFVGKTFGAAWRKRWKFHVALACTWVPLIWSVATISWQGNASLPNPNLDGLSPVMKSYFYALKQCEALAHYLALAIWPHLLNFSYGNDVVTDPRDVAPQIVVLAVLVGGVLYALWRRPAWGFLGAAFFVILAPTLSVVPLNGQTMAEHHMYLSLAALVVSAVMGLHAWLGRACYAVVLALALAFGGLTFERNRDYRTNVSIWSDTLEKAPDNARVLVRLSTVYLAADRPLDAMGCLETVLQLVPGAPHADTNMGNILANLGRYREAIVHYQNEIRRHPQAADTYYNLGNVYYVTRQPELARDAYIKAVTFKPDFALAHTNLASIYTDSLGEVDKAIVEYEAAVRADPKLPEARVGLGNLYLKTNRAAEAIPHFTMAISLNSKYGDAYLGLGNALLMTNQAAAAVTQYEAAARLLPASAGTRNNFGLALLQLHRYADAASQFEAALRLDSNYPQGQENLQKARQLAQSPPPASKP